MSSALKRTSRWGLKPTTTTPQELGNLLNSIAVNLDFLKQKMNTSTNHDNGNVWSTLTETLQQKKQCKRCDKKKQQFFLIMDGKNEIKKFYVCSDCVLPHEQATSIFE